jgi:ABC-type lipoprotein release transport system permease subunit
MPANRTNSIVAALVMIGLFIGSIALVLVTNLGPGSAVRIPGRAINWSGNLSIDN